MTSFEDIDRQFADCHSEFDDGDQGDIIDVEESFEEYFLRPADVTPCARL